MIDADCIHTAATTTRINLQQRPTVSRRLSSATLPDNTRLVNVSVNSIPTQMLPSIPFAQKITERFFPRTISLFLRKKSSVVSPTEAQNQLTKDGVFQEGPPYTRFPNPKH